MAERVNRFSQFVDYCNDLAPASRRRLPHTESDDTSLIADFSHNNYLGLAQHPQLLDAAIRAGQTYGVGATGSRLLSGDLPLYSAFEAEIAQTKGTEAALIFSSGYQANATVLAALLNAKIWGATPLVFSDRLNHASLHHACQLTGTHQWRYRHNDMKHLRQLLEQHHATPGAKFIVAETLFGMEGDQADTSVLAQLSQEFNAFLYLDEAHASGVLETQPHGDLVMGTFSKALGTSGAYVACSAAVRDYLVNRCTGLIYSTALSPMVVGAARAAWQLIPTLHAERAQLMSNATRLRHELHALGFSTGTSNTHIVPILIGDDAAAIDLHKFLLASKLRTSAIRPPTVPPRTARLRIALSTLHTTAHIDSLLTALHLWKTRC